MDSQRLATAYLLGSLAFLAMALSGCAKGANHGGAAPTPSASSSASAAPPVATATAPPPPDAGAPPRERPKRTGTPGSTRGTIACGKVRCKAPGEMCVWDEEAFTWSCVPAPKPAPDDPAPGLLCDDGSDCPPGEACCHEWLSSTIQSVCVPRAQVGRCSDELCVEGGARCPPGRTCKLWPGEDNGICEAEKGPATCAGKKRCPPAAPICVNGSHGLACVAQGTPEFDAVQPSRRWQCTRQSDCNAGDTCFFAVPEAYGELGTYCGRYTPALFGTLVCERGGASALPPDLVPGVNPCGDDAECRAKYACFPEEGTPPWLGGYLPKE